MATAEELIRGYAEALFRVVQAEGEVDRVEDELYRFGKLLETNHELKQALADQGIDRAQREKILDALLADKVSPHTLSMLQFIVGQGRARQLPQILEMVSEIAAEARNSVVAEVRSAVPLDDGQRKELQTALSKATGKDVTVKVLIDPSVIGGLVAKVGDTVIDGTVKRRLEQLRDQVRI
ncbi:MAG: F-type H+-transporting ATPase subunit delta [Actinomycetota bacterium]|jgi:F-type H+-transporting ATPase subunit delta|nr:F-type H+-transporting ATPase subunit delta [Actinomycetota bacterium]MEA2487548.1 F-type H+-transporting ATPase subunit delta [Actinomycetota bacterium]